MRERTERATVRWYTAGPHPNGMHADKGGLWIIDQGDNKLYEHAYEDGRVLRVLDTEADRASGLTWDGEYVWIASTYNCLLLKVDPKTGKTVAKLETPGAGVVPWRSGSSQRTGAHGLEWKDGYLWVATPPSGTIYQVDPSTGQAVRSFKAPGYRPHGLAWQDGDLWCVETNDRAFYRYNVDAGEMLEKIVVDGPEPHGMTIHDGQFWYCDAETHAVATIPLPR